MLYLHDDAAGAGFPRWPSPLQGRTVSFRNAVIIMTSNLGSADILAASRSTAGSSGAGGGADEAFDRLTRDRVMMEVWSCGLSLSKSVCVPGGFWTTLPQAVEGGRKRQLRCVAG